MLTPDDLDDVVETTTQRILDALVDVGEMLVDQDGRPWGAKVLTPEETVMQGALDAQSGVLDKLQLVDGGMFAKRMRELDTATQRVLAAGKWADTLTRGG